MDMKLEELNNKFKDNILDKVDVLYGYYVDRTNANTREEADNAQKNIISTLQSFGAVKRELDEFDKSLYQNLVNQYNFNFITANEYFNSDLFKNNAYFLSDGTLNNNINRRSVSIDEIKNINKKVEDVKVTEEKPVEEKNEEVSIAPGISVAPITSDVKTEVSTEPEVNTTPASNAETTDAVKEESTPAITNETVVSDVQVPNVQNENIENKENTETSNSAGSTLDTNAASILNVVPDVNHVAPKMASPVLNSVSVSNEEKANEALNESVHAKTTSDEDVQTIVPVEENENFQKINLENTKVNDELDSEFDKKFKVLNSKELEQMAKEADEAKERSKQDAKDKFMNDINDFSTSNIFISIVLIDQETDDVRNKETNGLTDNERREILVNVLNARREQENTNKKASVLAV